MNASAAVAAFLAAALAIVVPHPSFAADETIPPDSCNVTSGGIGSGNNTVTCNFGMPPEQLKAAIESAVNGHLIDRIVQISKTLGVTEDAAEKLLKIVGEDPDIPEEKLADALSKIAADYQRLQAQLAGLNPDNPTAKALVEQAKPEIDAGHFDRAHELLRQATQAQIAAAQEARKLREQAQGAEDAQMLGAASSTAAEGGVVMIERRYKEAAELFARAADYVPAGHPSEQGSYLAWQADALYQQGDERGDNDALRTSVEIWRRALTDYSRERAPVQWAATQNNLGTALEELGERESGTTRLEEAVVAYRAALEERTRERAPFQWAGTQNNLGNALLALGKREKGTEKLEKAVAAYSAALEEWTRGRVPLNWAMTQNNLGNALEALGERENDNARLEGAAAAYRTALEERTRERVPLLWATTQNNLGTVLTTLGAREGGTGKLGEAVQAFRAALQELKRERVPLLWASAQMNLGNALQLSGALEDGTGKLWEAVAAYREALDENTRERVPLDWATTQHNLGTVLAKLGERDSGTAWLDEAVKAYAEALTERTRERVPLDWAASLGSQGVAMMPIADRTNDRVLAETAAKQIETAAETLRTGSQEQWVAYYDRQLPKALAIRDRLKGK
jgi:tetratricopeptide (TPR) repeat protein